MLSCRVMWIFELFGHTGDVFLYNGNLSKWQRDGGTMTTEHCRYDDAVSTNMPTLTARRYDTAIRHANGTSYCQLAASNRISENKSMYVTGERRYSQLIYLCRSLFQPLSCVVCLFALFVFLVSLPCESRNRFVQLRKSNNAFLRIRLEQMSRARCFWTFGRKANSSV